MQISFIAIAAVVGVAVLALVIVLTRSGG